MEWLGRHYSAWLIGILIINYDFFGKDSLEGVLAFPAGDQVQDGDLALLEPSPADLVRTVNVDSPLNVALIILHEGPAVNDDRPLVLLVALAAFGHLLGQIIGVDDFDAGELLGAARDGAPHAAQRAQAAGILIAVDHLVGGAGGGGSGVGAAGARLSLGLSVLVVRCHSAATGTAASTTQGACRAVG